MKKFLFTLLITSASSLAVGGQDVFLEKVMDYVEKMQSQETKESYQKILELTEKETSQRKEIEHCKELIQWSKNIINAFDTNYFPNAEKIKSDKMKNLDESIGPEKLQEEKDKIIKQYNETMEFYSKKLNEEKSILEKRENDYYAALKKEKAISKELEKAKLKQQDINEFHTYKKFLQQSSAGQCFGFSKLFIQSMMFQWLPKTENTPNDINWLIKYYNMMTDWDKKSDFEKNDAWQIEALIGSAFHDQDNNGIMAKLEPGKHQFGDYAYQGKVRDVSITSNVSYKTTGTEKIKSIIESMKADGAGLGIIVSIKNQKDKDGHAVAIYRDPKGQWYLYDPNIGMDSLEALKIQVGKEEDPIETVVNKLAHLNYGAYGNEYNFFQITLDQ